MKQVRLSSVIALIFALFIFSCKSETPTVQPEPPAPPQPLSKSHTLVVFMQGDNGLEQFMDVNLQRVITAYYDIPQELGRIIIFYDRGNYTRLTELYMDDGMVKQRLIEEYNVSQSTVDPAFMASVFDRIRDEAPADSYGLILSSHGGGWVPSELYDAYMVGSDTRNMARPSFYAQDGFDCMEVEDLASSIDAMHFNYILFDACFMSSVEALYDMRHSADYIIASAAEVLGTGFPYESIIPMLFKREDHMLQAVCEEFMALYRDTSGTIALIDCLELDGLATAMKSVVAAAGDTSDVDTSKVQAYDGFESHLYFDLEQYVEQIASGSTLDNFRKALDNAVIFNDHSTRFYTAEIDDYLPLPRSCGVTCHVEQSDCPITHQEWLKTAWAKAIGGK